MFCQVEQLVRAHFSWTEPVLGFFVNVLGEPVQSQSLEQLVGVAQKLDGSFPGFRSATTFASCRRYHRQTSMANLSIDKTTSYTQGLLNMIFITVTPS